MIGRYFVMSNILSTCICAYIYIAKKKDRLLEEYLNPHLIHPKL